MARSRHLAALFLAALLIACWIPRGAAQAITGSLTGTITDPNGASISNTEVQITNIATGLVRKTTSDAEGNFRLLQLPAGTYTLDATNSGFKAFRRENIIVEADRSVAVPVSLELGTVNEVVDVKGGADLLDTNTSSLGTTLEQRKVEELPLRGLNPMGLANLVPTVSGIGYFGGQVLSGWRMAAVSIGGGQSTSNSFLVDGIAGDKLFTGGTMNFPTIGSTQEFKVITNAMSAEFGQTGGGIISMVTKSGTNEIHGELFEFLRNSALNANEFFANKSGQARAPLVWNQFGGSIGGPIKKDKLFYFATYEAQLDNGSTQNIYTSPTILERSGDFSQTRTATGAQVTIYNPFSSRPDPNSPGRFVRDPFPGNVIPAYLINKVGSNILSYYPKPNLPGLPNTHAQNLFTQAPAPIDRYVGTGKLDWDISPTQRLTGRYTNDILHWQFARLFGTPAEPDGRLVQIPRKSAAVSYTNSLSASLLLEAKVGFSRENEHSQSPGAGFDMGSLGFPASFVQATSPGANVLPRYPTMTVADMPGTFGGSGGNGDPALTTLSSVALTKISGQHTIKTGFEHRYYSINLYGRGCAPGCFNVDRGFTQGPDPLVASAASGYGPASLLLGLPASGTTNLSADETVSVRYVALFAQDDWKATRKLTFNLGLRWEYEGPMTDRYNVLANFDPSIQSPLKVPGYNLTGGLVYPGVNGLDRALTVRHFGDFSPRFGFAYQLNPKTVLRGGFGLIYIPGTPISNSGPPRTGYSRDSIQVTSIDGGITPLNTLSNPYPNGLDQPTGSSLGALTGIGSAITGELRDIHRGYTEQWNFTVQHEPWRNWLVEVAWVGSHGIHLLGFDRNLDFISDQNRSLGAAALSGSIANPFKGLIATGPLSGPTVTRFQSLLPYPQYTGVDGGYSFIGNSIYNAFTLKVEKRFSQGFSIITAYTFSKLLDDGQNVGQIRPGATTVTGVQDWNNLRLERSQGSQDIPQRLVFTALYELPFGKNGSALNRMALGGWQLNSITTIESGQPISLAANVAGGGNRPNVVPGVNAKLSNPTINEWFNTAAFSIPAPYTLGNVSRTLPGIRSDRLFDMDFSVLKNIPIRERFNLQFRAEAFNLTNTPTFDVPGRVIGSATFGVVTATAFNPKPREVQFGLRLTF